MKRFCLAVACLLAVNTASFAVHNFTLNGHKVAYYDNQTDTILMEFEFEKPGACADRWFFIDANANGRIEPSEDPSRGRRPGACDGIAGDDQDGAVNGKYVGAMGAKWFGQDRSYIWVMEDNGIRDTVVLMYRKIPTNHSISIQLPLPIRGVSICLDKTPGVGGFYALSDALGRILVYIPDSLAGSMYECNWTWSPGLWSAPNHVVTVPQTRFPVAGHTVGPPITAAHATAWIAGAIRTPEGVPFSPPDFPPIIRGMAMQGAKGRTRSQVKVNKDGTYRLPVTAGTKWGITVSALKHEGYRVFAQGREIVPSAGQTIPNIDFVVYPKDAVLAGKITCKGNPVVGHRVSIRFEQFSKSGPFYYYPYARSDETGTFRVRVPSGIDEYGRYEVKITVNGEYSRIPAKYDSVKSNTCNLDFKLFKRPGVASRDPIKHVRFALEQNLPNPFNPYTSVRYSIPGSKDKSLNVSLAVFSAIGCKIRVLASGPKAPGTHIAAWDGKDSHGTPCPSGMYFYKLEAGDFVATRRMLMVK